MSKDKGTDAEVKETETGSEEEAATQPEEEKEESAAADQEDVRNLQSQRDKNYESAKTAEEKLEALEMRQEFLETEAAKKEYIEKVVKENKFTDRESKILSRAESPEDADELAKTLKTYREEAESEALSKLQAPEQDPGLDPETAEKKLKKLEDTGDLETVFDTMWSTKQR